jgi:hypothetical protein
VGTGDSRANDACPMSCHAFAFLVVTYEMFIEPRGGMP